MNVLGIETATAVCGAALSVNGAVLADEWIEAPQVHAEKLLALIDGVLHAGSMPAASLDAIAVSIGPGSFTGLRIGLSAAKGLALALGKPLVAVPTLEAAALHAMRHTQCADGAVVAVALESRRDEIFWGCYRAEEHLPVAIEPARALPVTEAAARVRALHNPILTGSGAVLLHAALGDHAGSVELAPAEGRRGSASAVALLGTVLLGRNEIADLANVEPLYLKEFYTTAKPVQTS